MVGLRSVGSFTTSFGAPYGMSPTAYRATFPPAANRAVVPTCIVLLAGPLQSSTFREDRRAEPLANVASDSSEHRPGGTPC